MRYVGWAEVPQFGSKDPLDSLAGGKIIIIHVKFISIFLQSIEEYTCIHR